MSRLLQKSLLVMGNCHKFGSSGTKQRSFVTLYTLSEKDNFCRKLCREEGGKFVRQMIVRTLFWQHFFHCTSFFLIYWSCNVCVVNSSLKWEPFLRADNVLLVISAENQVQWGPVKHYWKIKVLFVWSKNKKLKVSSLYGWSNSLNLWASSAWFW